MKNNRRSFIKKTALGTTAISLGASKVALSAKSYKAIVGANDRINMSVIGVRGQGNGHLRRWSQMAKEDKVFVKTICDVDENLFADRVISTGDIQGEIPGTEVDMRKVFDDADIDAVSIATPNHWHALATIWAVQAGKHVYVEKPCSHNVWEGRQMIEAARKYNRIVQVGFQNRSISNVRQAMQALHNGAIGEVYMAKGLCYKPRGTFGSSENSAPPAGLHYDMWLGPAKWRPYNEKRGHYNWHWHWNTGNGDTGNQGPHQFDIARWGMGKDQHPVKVQSTGGYFKYTDCSQETPNTQSSVFEYEDGKVLQFETRGLDTNGEGKMGVKIGNIFYGTDGWMEVNGSKWRVYHGKEGEPGIGSDGQQSNDAVVGYLAAPGGGGHYANFIAAIRSGDMADLTCDIYEGFLSTALPHLANISYRLGGLALDFNPVAERFTNSEAANDMLTREYRAPYIVPDKV
jgi:predicted dehydrogenase